MAERKLSRFLSYFTKFFLKTIILCILVLCASLGWNDDHGVSLSLKELDSVPKYRILEPA